MRTHLITSLAVAALLGSSIHDAHADTTAAAPATKSTNIAGTVSAGSFNDMKGHWAEAIIAGAIQKGYIDGYQDHTFKPDKQVTRAEFIKMADSALHISVSGVATGSDWYLPYVNAAVSAGIHEWSDFTSGDWNTLMTRQEMARIAVRAATGDKNTEDKKWMYLATKAGLITGMDDTGTLGEDQTTTRAQAAATIERILSMKGGQTLSVDKHAVSRAEIVWHKTNIITMLPRYFEKTTNGERFHDELLTTTTADGNMSCSVNKYVVVDMDDPDDPNRSLVLNDVSSFQWKDGKTGNWVHLRGDNYIVVTEAKMKINSFPANTSSITGCSAGIPDRAYDASGDLDSKGVLSRIAGVNLTYKKDGHEATYITYTDVYRANVGDSINETRYYFEAVPKGNLTPTAAGKQTRIVFNGINTNSPTLIYSGVLSDQINQ